MLRAESDCFLVVLSGFNFFRTIFQDSLGIITMADDKSSSAPIPTAMAVSITQMNPKDREKFYDELEFPYCDEVNKYEKMAKIGQGTFGEVFKARHKKNKKIVALKKVLMENEKEGVRE